MRTTAFVLLFAAISINASAQESVPAATSGGSNGGLYIKIGEAKTKKSLLAIPPFQFTGSPGSSKNGIKVGKELTDVFKNDMDSSGFFELIKPAAYLEDGTKIGLKPAGEEPNGFKYPAWKSIGTEFLVRVGYRMLGDDVTVDTYTYYIPQAKLILGKTYKGKASAIRTIAHTFANDLVKELTGNRGFFLTQIVTSRSTRPGEKEIFIMDWDGANSRQVSHHMSIAQSPAWSFDGKKIAYSAFTMHTQAKSRNLDLFTYDVETGKRFVVSYRSGINSGASFCPDNRHLLLTVTNGGNPDIYQMTIDGRSLEAITHGKGSEMSMEPAMSSDGKKIAFSSTRTGKPMIHVVDADGSNNQRLTLAGEYNSAPAWSPDNKRIAFAGQEAGHFDIFIMDSNGGNMIRVTSAKKPNGKWSNNEDPSFSPDGRHVLYRSNRTGKYQLYMSTSDGEDERRLTFDDHDYYRPRWSPFLD